MGTCEGRHTLVSYLGGVYMQILEPLTLFTEFLPLLSMSSSGLKACPFTFWNQLRLNCCFSFIYPWAAWTDNCPPQKSGTALRGTVLFFQELACLRYLPAFATSSGLSNSVLLFPDFINSYCRCVNLVQSRIGILTTCFFLTLWTLFLVHVFCLT